MKAYENHPCFNPDAKGKFGRVHLPVAPKCNVQCGFCNRKFDCVNESRPGVTSTLLSPGQALHYVHRLVDIGKPISVAGIAGPGDPFANPHETMATLRLLHRRLPDILLCVSTNGLGILPYVDELAELQVSHVTITISAVDPEIGQHIYRWIRDGKRVYRGIEAARIMIERQTAAVKALKAAGITVKINSILIPGVNDEHMVDIACQCHELGADLHNVIPLSPVEGTDFASVPEPDSMMVNRQRALCGEWLPQMTHCQRCRADACGMLKDGTTQETLEMLREAAAAPVVPDENRPYVAVASHEGMLVNQHLGEADSFRIYAKTAHEVHCIGERDAPPKGGGMDRWQTLAERLSDCRAILVASAGPKPTEVISKSGVKVIVMEGLIEEAVEAVLEGRAVKAPVRAFKCGAGCTGDGSGCG